jgi:hypothetical protein
MRKNRFVFILTIFVFLIYLLPSIIAENENIKISVDKQSQTVNEGETAFFNWTVINEDSMTYEFIAKVEGDADFNPSTFLLEPNEKGYSTLKVYNNTYGLHRSFFIVWQYQKIVGNIKGSVESETFTVSVDAKRGSSPSPPFIFVDKVGHSEVDYSGVYIGILIIILLISGIIIRKRRSSE